MQISKLRLRNFRNYDELDLDDLGKLVVLCGPNAAGKTNALEAINLITSTASFRHPQISQLVKEGCTTARIEALMTDGNRELLTTLALETGKKRFQVNGKAKSVSEVKGTLPAVSFIPDDLDLAKRSSSIRRTALDELGTQLSKSYDVVHGDYQKTLRYKNRLLKDESPEPLIDAIDETLVAVGSQLYCYRRSLFERIIPLVQQNYQRIARSGEQFSAAYVPSWLRMQARHPNLSSFSEESSAIVSRDEARTYIYDALSAFRGEERRARRSFIGPHNDQITFYLQGRDASSFASQGQQRSIVLSWKLAEVQMVKNMLGVDPVLLLDDVMSELDESRRNLLVESVGETAQTFITTTDLSSFNPAVLSEALVITIG